jgi:cell wall-associated NlpC family hydrolase
LTLPRIFPILPRMFCRSAPRSLSRATLFLAAGLLCLAAAQAAPDTSSSPDAVSRMLQDKGLVTPSSSAVSSPPAAARPGTTAPSQPGFVQQFRDSTSGMVLSAMNFLGVPYRRGGTSAEDGFDCSGFTRYLFENSFGLILPRRADEQASAPGLQKVKRDDLEPGDLVFFNTLKRTFSHVGIYVGEGKFIHAPRSGANVRVEDMRFSYWSKRFTGARRPATQSTAPSAVAEPSPQQPPSGDRMGSQGPARVAGPQANTSNDPALFP